jgi:hypothetical protein
VFLPDHSAAWVNSWGRPSRSASACKIGQESDGVVVLTGLTSGDRLGDAGQGGLLVVGELGQPPLAGKSARCFAAQSVGA